MGTDLNRVPSKLVNKPHRSDQLRPRGQQEDAECPLPTVASTTHCLDTILGRNVDRGTLKDGIQANGCSQ